MGGFIFISFPPQFANPSFHLLHLRFIPLLLPSVLSPSPNRHPSPPKSPSPLDSISFFELDFLYPHLCFLSSFFFDSIHLLFHSNFEFDVPNGFTYWLL
ncbi:unnamed protein product [Lupinus luteus]|uniref:Uncharacterized protein n=1 Tax=Lupinus luteus TaxID=3873 RepID=A0AAV1XY77_LUPLU